MSGRLALVVDRGVKVCAGWRAEGSIKMVASIPMSVVSYVLLGLLAVKLGCFRGPRFPSPPRSRELHDAMDRGVVPHGFRQAR
jgi:hypothetical protein